MGRVLLLIGVAAGCLLAQPAAAQDDEIPPAVTCTFDKGSSWTISNGQEQSSPIQPLTFSIADINLEAQSAKLVADGKEQTGTLRIVRAISANHFLEVANEGFLNLTTVYAKDAASGFYPAVHSRHFALLGQPLFAQYAGFCKARG